MSDATQPRSALFVIDIQNDLAADANTKVPHAERVKSAGHSILDAVRAIVDSYRRRSEVSPFIIAFIQHQEAPSEGLLVRGSEPWKLVFEPRSDVDEEWLIAKTTRDTFQSNPDLAARLRSVGVGEIVAFGIRSEACVEETCKGALTAGFQVTLLAGAHSTYDVEGKSALMIEEEVEGRLQAGGARILECEEALRDWAKKTQVS